MYANTGYYHSTDMDLEDLSQPLIVESCGIYRFRTRTFNTTRPHGRKDYQLIYIASGRAFFDFGEQPPQELCAGKMVLYRPGVPQNYIYYADDKPEVYWLHFTGSDVSQLLDHAGITPAMHIIDTGISSDFPRLFLQIIRELQLKRPCYEELLVLLLEQIFVLIRRYLQHIPGSEGKIQKEVEHAVEFFNENFSTELNINEYAAGRHISTCWFIRSFRSYTGMTPMQYITSIRIAKARSLLTSTDYNVSEISEIVGYNNPLYFSRIFKKLTGSSPANYRKHLVP